MNYDEVKSTLRCCLIALVVAPIFGCANLPEKSTIPSDTKTTPPPTPAEKRLLDFDPNEKLSPEKEIERQAAKDEVEGQTKFAGLSFGAGISLTIDTGSHDRVKGAQIVNGIVRVDDVDDTIARVMMESHYFFQANRRFFNVESGNWGFGPFLALQPGSDDVIEALGLGVMLGFKRPGKEGTSWNIGLGFVVDPDTQILGDGFVENQPPPAGEEQVRFKEISQEGILFVVSFGF